MMRKAIRNNGRCTGKHGLQAHNEAIFACKHCLADADGAKVICKYKTYHCKGYFCLCM